MNAMKRNPLTPQRKPYPHRGNNGIRRHPPQTRALAIAARSAETAARAAEIADVPVRTLTGWMARFRVWGDSELEPFIAREKAVMAGSWAVLGVAGQELAMECRRKGDATGYLRAMTGAGIADTKLERLGQPKTVDGTASRDLVYLNPPPAEPPDDHSTHES